MKNKFIAIFASAMLIVGFAGNASAQGLGIRKSANLYSSADGRLYIGGGFVGGFGSNGGAIGLIPEIGYRLSNNWSLGAIAGYTFNYYSNRDYNVHRILVDPYVRWQYPIANVAWVFVDGFAQYNYLMFTNGYSNTSVFKTGIRPGIALPLGNHIYLTARIGYLGYMKGEGGNNDGKFTYHCTRNDVMIGVSVNL